jgi:hypothetical protein
MRNKLERKEEACSFRALPGIIKRWLPGNLKKWGQEAECLAVSLLG